MLPTTYIFIQGAELSFFKVSKVHVQCKVHTRFGFKYSLDSKKGPVSLNPKMQKPISKLHGKLLGIPDCQFGSEYLIRTKMENSHYYPMVNSLLLLLNGTLHQQAMILLYGSYGGSLKLCAIPSAFIDSIIVEQGLILRNTSADLQFRISVANFLQTFSSLVELLPVAYQFNLTISLEKNIVLKSRTVWVIGMTLIVRQNDALFANW